MEARASVGSVVVQGEKEKIESDIKKEKKGDTRWYVLVSCRKKYHDFHSLMYLMLFSHPSVRDEHTTNQGDQRMRQNHLPD